MVQVLVCMLESVYVVSESLDKTFFWPTLKDLTTIEPVTIVVYKNQRKDSCWVYKLSTLIYSLYLEIKNFCLYFRYGKSIIGDRSHYL